MDTLGVIADDGPRIALTTVAFYVTLLATLRISGRRTLAQLSAFDAVITIALGSLLASTATGPPGSYGRNVVALVVLLALQTVVATLRKRSGTVRRLVDFQPEDLGRGSSLDLRSGPFGPQLTEQEVHSRLRDKGVFDPSQAASVILEPAGQISVRTDRVGPA